MQPQREKRIRKLVRQLNRQRHKQAEKIDILCNDMVKAHRDFIKKLRSFSFAANFYESILGSTDLKSLLDNTCELINSELPDSNTAFFIVGRDSFEIHKTEAVGNTQLDIEQLKSCFYLELAKNICSAAKICLQDDLLEMGFEAAPAILSKNTFAAVPLGLFGPPTGFILVYRSAKSEFTSEEMERVALVTPGLLRAIKAYQLQAI